MRTLFPIFILSLRAGLILLVCAGMPVRAQVTVNLDALNPLPQAGGSREGAAPSNRRAPARRHTRHVPHAMAALPVPPIPPATSVATTAPTETATAAPGTTASAPPSSTAPQPAAHVPPAPAPAAVLPAAPPPEVALAPIVPAEPSAAPPPPPPVTATADSRATPTAGGLTVTFGADAADLSPVSAAAIKALAQSVPQTDATSFNVLAFAAGAAQDPSSARRLSLARALAIRGALMAAGVSSTRIYVRALGSASGSGPANRADISIMGANAPKGTTAGKPAAETAASTPATTGPQSGKQE